MKVLVTGANGFLGRHAVARFRRRGHDVRALVRPAADLNPLRWDSGVEIVRADLRAGADLRQAIESVDAVVHLAAAVSGGEYGQFVAAVRGTERLLEAMAQTSVKRLVMASSFSVYDWSHIRGTLSEDSPVECEPYERDGYAIAKIWQERVARRMSEEHQFQLTVLRPGFLWGSGNEYTYALGQQVGRFHLLVGPMRRPALSHVENCADAFVHATENPAAIGHTFNVIDTELPTVWLYAAEYLRGTGTSGIRVPIPYWLGKSITHLAQFTSRILFNGKGKLPSILIPCRFEARFKPMRFSNAKLRDVLGWSPPLDFQRCLLCTYETREPQRISGNESQEPDTEEFVHA